MPNYRIYLKNLTDTSHKDPAPGQVKEIPHTADSPQTVESKLLEEISKTCSEPHTHYSWTIQEIGL